MKRKEFLQLGSSLAVGSLLNSFSGCNDPKSFIPTTNWAGNISFSTGDIVIPKTSDEVINLIKVAHNIKAQGTTHCFNRIADNKKQLMAMKSMNKVVELNKEQMTVTVEAGMRYGDLAPYLHENGLALHNLASLPHISIAGSISTATHGSGVNNGNLATAVRSIEMVDGTGKLIVLSRDKDEDAFNGAVVALGALGVVTKVTLDVQPAYDIKQYVYEALPNESLYSNFESIMGAAYSVSLFTDWQSDSVNEVWVKTRTDGANSFSTNDNFFGARPATRDMHPIAANDAVHCTTQMGIAGPWFERLPHFKMGFTPSSGVELQAEYFVPFEQGAEAMKTIAAMKNEIGPHLYISEIRAIAADDLWLSTAYKRKSIAIHFTWKQETEAVMALLPKIENALAPFSPRPHWGKLFTIHKDILASRYERMNDFKQLALRHDPEEKFVNDFLTETIF